MKNLIFISLLLLSSLGCSAQTQHVYLEFGSMQILRDANSDVVELILMIPNAANGDNDYYRFTTPIAAINTNGNSIPDIVLDTPVNLKNPEFTKMAPCELHSVLSKQHIILVKQDKASGKYHGWHTMYFGTYRNIVVTPH